MEISAGERRLVLETVKWVAIVGACVLGWFYFEDVRQAFAPDTRIASTSRETAAKPEKRKPGSESEATSGWSEDEPAAASSSDAESTSEASADAPASNAEEPPARGSSDDNPISEGAGFVREVHLEAAQNGHFYAEAYIEGKAVQVVVDTGATSVALSYEDAEAIGIRPVDSDYTHLAQTANGTSRIAPVRIGSIRIGDIEVRDVQAFVAEEGKLFGTLLGMTFLGKLERVDIRGRQLILVN